MSNSDACGIPVLQVFSKETMRMGQWAHIECINIGGQTYSMDCGLVTMLRLEDEWYEDVADPEAVIDVLKRCSGSKPDIFTFWQRLPDTEPSYPFHVEWEELAVLPVTSHEQWWTHQIKSRVRNQIRKSEKAGVVVKEVAYDDDFVRGMTAIFNETPVRQGRRFWHYGKDFQTVKKQFSRNIHREDLIGAYYQNEMIGYLMLANAGRYGVISQIISAMKHRDKSPNNALIAKAVEVCERRKLRYLVYLFWTDDSLAEFKRRCGFEKARVPRYFVPVTRKGNMALKLGLHRGWKQLLPTHLKTPLKKVRPWLVRG